MAIDFVRARHAWAAPVAFAFAFLESIALFSLLIPGWAVLVSIGVLAAASDIPFWPVWIAGAVGAALGDWISYWLGYKFKEPIGQVWPLSRYPDRAAMPSWNGGAC
jgi:membrane protein DedA with SNARE-associated domain